MDTKSASKVFTGMPSQWTEDKARKAARRYAALDPEHTYLVRVDEDPPVVQGIRVNNPKIRYHVLRLNKGYTWQDLQDALAVLSGLIEHKLYVVTADQE